MKLALQIILCLVGVFAAYLILITLFGVAIQAVILCSALAAIVGVCRWQYTRWQSRRLPGNRSIQKVEQKAEKALRELERKVNKV